MNVESIPEWIIRRVYSYIPVGITQAATQSEIEIESSLNNIHRVLEYLLAIGRINQLNDRYYVPVNRSIEPVPGVPKLDVVYSKEYILPRMHSDWASTMSDRLEAVPKGKVDWATLQPATKPNRGLAADALGLIEKGQMVGLNIEGLEQRNIGGMVGAIMRAAKKSGLKLERGFNKDRTRVYFREKK